MLFKSSSQNTSPLIKGSALIILVIAAWLGIKAQMAPKPTPSASPSTIASTTPSPETTIGPVSIQKPSSELVTAGVEGNKLVLNHYDLKTKKLKTKQPIATTDSVLSGSSCGENTKVQFLDNGSVFYIDGNVGGMGDEDSEKIYSAIYKAPDIELYKATQTEGFFQKWIVNAAGTIVYVAQPLPQTNSTSPYKYKIISVDVASKKVATIGEIGEIDGELFMSSDEKTIAAIEERERKEGNENYHDTYLRSISLTSGKSEEKLLVKQATTGWSDYGDCRAKLDPSLSTLISSTTSFGSERTMVKKLDIKTLKEETVYTIGGLGQVNPLTWSDSGAKAFFNVNYLSETPPDQGLIAYDPKTGKSERIVASNIKVIRKEGSVRTGETRLVDGSATDKGIFYEENSSPDGLSNGKILHYYDAGDKKSYQLSDGVVTDTVISAHRYE